MKTQMRFQKLILKLTLIVAALAIVYALAFCTGAIAYIGRYQDMAGSEIRAIFGSTTSDSYMEFLDLLGVYDAAQTYTTLLLWLGIVFILLVVVCYAFAGATRRNYYKSNYITIGILAGFAIVWAVLAVVFSLQVQMGVLGSDAWNVTFANYAAANAAYYYSSNTVVYIIGYIFAIVVIVDALALIYNCIWKAKLMKGEKELLQKGAAKEVA
ncbi:MAG: hypothetical protein LUI60_06535 [Clostridia bacterium]|nr:hypothetical protein [Clostridia bacterium]